MKRYLCKMFSCLFAVMLIGTQNSILALDDVGVVEGRIINVTEPINNKDVANKKYIDDIVAMLPEPAVVLQEMTGESETAVLSVKAVKNAIQNAVTEAINELTLNTADMLKNALIDQINKIYPVGSIYMSVDSSNPGTLFGGSWSAWGQGRVPLGMGSNGTTNYTTVQATNNSNTETHTLTTSQMPSHEGHVPNASYAWGDAGENTYVLDKNSGAVFQHATNRPYVLRAGNEMCIRSNPAGNGNAHNNMQPYITCYMWLRTA